MSKPGKPVDLLSTVRKKNRRAAFLAVPASLALSLFVMSAQAETIRLGVDAMRQLAFTALQAGFAQQALTYTDALLTRDPADTTALIIRAQALRALGRAPEARSVAKQAWDLADTDKARFGAAMAMAQALSTMDRRTAAQLWLRRAVQNAPNDRARDIARRDFGYVKSRNPWVLQFDGTASPSSNINNGSRQTQMSLSGLPILFEIPAQNQALSGFELGFGVTSTYRFAPTDRAMTEARFALNSQISALSPAAKAAAPLARNADYTFAAAEVGLQQTRKLSSRDTLALRLSGTLGHNWYGGDDLSDYLRLSMGLDQKLPNGASLRFGVSADKTARLDSPLQSSDRVAVTLGYTLAVGAAGQDRLTFGLEAATTTSASAEVRSTAQTASLEWTRAAPIAGIALSAGLQIGSQRFADSGYVSGGRDDLKLSANLSMTFQTIDYYGFSPVLTLQASKNRSNSALHDSESFGIALGIQSSF